MKELLTQAARLGLTVHAAHLEPGILGMYSPDEHRIYFDIGLTMFERRSVLGHELGHAYYGHSCDDAANDLQADIFAARLLVHPDDYAQLERLGADHDEIAEHFRITPDVVETFRTRCLTKVRGATYVRPKLGAGQWAYRSVHA